MRKSIISFLAMVMVVGLLIGCNSGGGGQPYVPALPVYDATGTWSIDEVTDSSVYCNTVDASPAGDQVRQEFMAVYNGAIITVNQTGSTFTIFIDKTGESFSGTIDDHTYTYSSSEVMVVQGYTIDLSFTGVITLISPTEAIAYVDYHGQVRGFPDFCDISISFSGTKIVAGSWGGGF